MSILLKAIDDSETVISVTSDPLLPASFGVIQIGTEQIMYLENYMGTLYGCNRGFNSSTAAIHAKGASIQLLAFFGVGPLGVVTSIRADSNADIMGSIQLASGNGVTLTQVNNTITFDMAFPDPLVLGNGTIPAPSLTFNTFLDSGISCTTGGLDFSVGGSAIATISNTDLYAISFTTDTLVIANSLADTGTGFYGDVGLLTVNIAADGDQAASFDKSVAAGETRMLLWDVDSGILQRVKVTANDAVLGVTGRVLYIDDIGA